MKARQAEAISEVLRRVVRELDIEKKLVSHSIEPAWPRAAGPRLSANTRATKLRDGVLTIEARSASWLNEVAMMREPLKARLNQELGENRVRELRFRLGGGFPPPADETQTTVEPTEAEIASARRTLAEAGVEGADIVARAYVLSHRR
jgi:hypothetical protein